MFKMATKKKISLFCVAVNSVEASILHTLLQEYMNSWSSTKIDYSVYPAQYYHLPLITAWIQKAT